MNDTWEWDGTTWTMVSSGGPSPRENYGIAYDSLRGKTVLYGGYDNTVPVYRGDTWEGPQ